MEFINYFYNCSRDYIESIDNNLYREISEIIKILPKRPTQAEINKDFFWLFTASGWSYDSRPSGISKLPPTGININKDTFNEITNNRDLCLSATTLKEKWHCDFAKIINGKLIQIEVQFGKVESMFKDFCGFKIAHHEHRLSLGIEIILIDPNKYFQERKASISGMAYYDVAKNTLPLIGFNCPIWLIGMK